jgi:hypothetical protein
MDGYETTGDDGTIGRMDIAEFQESLRAAEPQFRDLNCRLVPSSFENEASPALPRAFDWYWSSCDSVLRDHTKHGVMMRLPTSWQIEPALHTVCRSLHVPIFACDPTNIPLAAAALEATGIDAVVTVADNFATELVSRLIPLPTTWLVIHAIEAETWPGKDSTPAPYVRHEVHLFPGVPILHSCEKDNFHPSDEYQWEFESGSAHITSRNDLFPFQRLKLPVLLESRGVCPCGKESIERV